MSSIQLSIAEPCHENWNSMLPEEKGRFCLSCQKTVVDFTGMTDGQIFDYFRSYKGSTCGQFAPEQLNRNIAKPATRSIGRWKYFWQILLPAVFAFYKGEAQPLKGKVSSVAVCKPDTSKQERIMLGMVAMSQPAPKYKLQGTILNENGEPVPGTTLVSQSGKGVQADGSGHFSVEINPGQNLTISSVGYETKVLAFDSILPKLVKSIEVDKKANAILVTADIQLKMNLAKLGEVVVIAGYVSSRRSRTIGGAVSTIRSETLFPNPKTVKPKTDLPVLKIFPNPIQPGQSFEMGLQVKKTGTYFLQVTDVTGKVMITEKLNITSKNQTEVIDGSVLQQAGVYFISVSNPGNKDDKGLSGRIVVQ